MLPEIKNLIDCLTEFKENINSTVIELSALEKARIIDWNIEQLEKGMEATGQFSTPGYRPLTIRIKEEKGQPSNIVTLKDEGDFHDSFIFIQNPTSFAITATDEKAERLENKYGKDIYGLSAEHLQELINLIKPELIALFRSQLNLAA